jgi:hypothetical protein
MEVDYINSTSAVTCRMLTSALFQTDKVFPLSLKFMNHLLIFHDSYSLRKSAGRAFVRPYSKSSKRKLFMRNYLLRRQLKCE